MVAAVLFRVYHLERFLALGYIKASQARFAAMYAGHPVAVIGSYMGIYILVTALSLPGAAVMTLGGGAATKQET